VVGLGRVGVVAGDGVVGEAPQQVGPRRALRAYWKVPTRRWLDATRASTAPGSTVSRRTVSPVATTASERVVGMPRACMASLMRYSRSIGPTAALPSPPRAKGVRPEPFRWRSPAAVGVDQLAEEQRPPVAERGRVAAELVAGVGLRHRHGALGGVGARQHPPPGGGAQRLDVEPQLAGQRVVQHEQLGTGRRKQPRLVSGKSEVCQVLEPMRTSTLIEPNPPALAAKRSSISSVTSSGTEKKCHDAFPSHSHSSAVNV
jgi:hypothetical protein